MMLAEFQELLKRTIGLDTASVGSSVIARAVQTRMSACDLADPQAYRDYVEASPTELQELVEAVVIPETWFFRDREAFVAMAQIAREEWLASHSQGAMRLLSLPCASGEEPYSMAMALLDADFPPERICIDAVDVSASLLARAQRAHYRNNSFRGTELGFRDRYFEPTAHGDLLDGSVRGLVRFRQGNLFDADPLPGLQGYDVVFCRNVLIYFDAAAQIRVIDLLARLLAADGLLFVGPPEANLLHSRGFVPIGRPLTFGFRKAVASRLAKLDRAQAVERRGTPQTTGAPPSAPAGRSTAAPRAPPRPTPRRKPSLDEIHRIADQGRLGEAERHCEEYLRDHDPSSEALHLLGLIRDAAGNSSAAADCYRKSLYLDPDHHQALVHLALLLEKQGDRTRARALSERARRLDRNGTK
jgi:chemotaxis protein methyltransferase WspC